MTLYKKTFIVEKAIALAALRLANAMESSGLSNEEVAKKAGISMSTLNKVLRGSSVSLKSLASISYAVGCEMDFVLTSSSFPDKV